MKTVRFRQSKLGLSVFLCLMGLFVMGMTTSAYHTKARDTTVELGTIWKADTSTHPILTCGFMGADAQGNLYVADRGADGYTYQIVHFSPDGAFVKAWGASGSGPGEFNWRPDNPDEGPDAGFVAADDNGNVYVSDGYNFRVQKFDNDGEFLLEWGSAGEELGQFQPPTVGPVSIDSQGKIYVSDFAHVQTFDSTGYFLSVFGSFGTDGGQFQGVGQVGWDSQGNRYVPDLLNGRVQKFDSAGKFLQQIGAPGDGDGEFFMPVQVLVDSQDHIFVMDNTNRLQVFDTDGNYIDKLVRPGNGDGPFESICPVAMDGQGNLYVQFYHPGDGVTIYKFRYALSYRPEDGATFDTFSLQ